MAKSEAACLMHVRVVTVASEVRISVRRVSGETECRGVFGPISFDTKGTMPMTPLIFLQPESAPRSNLHATGSHHDKQLATYLTSLPNNFT